jgi:hypothetical protein
MAAGKPKPYHQTITYWGTPQPDGMGGVVFAAPVSMLARWEQNAIQDYDDKGTAIVSQARVFTKVDLDIGGFVFLGITAATDPTVIGGAFEIKNFVKTPSIRLNDYERRSVL